MYKQIVGTSLAVASLLIGTTAHAVPVAFDATFTEQWFIGGNGNEAGAGGTANANQDNATDLFSIKTSYSGPAVSFQMTSVVITFDDTEGPIYLDVTAGGAGFDSAFAFAQESGSTASLASTPTTADSQQDLTLSFLAFDENDIYNWSVDLDDSNAVIRGTNGSGSNSDFQGSTIVVNYTSGGQSLAQTFTYGGLTSDNVATLSGELDAQLVPEPSTLAILGLGLLGLSYRRFRNREDRA